MISSSFAEAAKGQSVKEVCALNYLSRQSCSLPLASFGITGTYLFRNNNLEISWLFKQTKQNAVNKHQVDINPLTLVFFGVIQN